MVMNAALLTAIQLQPVPVITLTLPTPPPDPKDALLELSEKLQVPPAWVTVNN